MRSPLLALFIRSVRQDARSGATYWARAGLGLFILLVLLFVALTSSWVGAPGRGFFITIIILQMIAVTFVGLSYFASAIAEEKEEQTLGLLRMTGLDSLSILLGKSTSRLCGALLFITAQLPFTIFALTLGGVSLRQIAAAYCTMIAFTFFLCNLALLGSVLARRTAGAVVFCLCSPVLLSIAWSILKGLHYLLDEHSGLRSPLDRVAAVIPAISPLGRLGEIFETGFSDSAIGSQVIADLASGVGCFLLAWALFERLCDRSQDKAFAVSRTPPAKGAKRGFFLRWLHPPRAWKDPFLWKDFYFLHGGRMGFAIHCLLYGGVVFANAWQFIHGHSPVIWIGLNGSTNSLLPYIFSIDLAVMTGRIFRVEINEQTLATLRVLPLTIRQIAARKLRACLLAAAPGAICALADQIFFLIFLGDPSNQVAPGSLGGTTLVQMLNGWLTIALVVALVAWLSLSMKRGAAPLGWVITYAVSSLVYGIGMFLVFAISAASSFYSSSIQMLGSGALLATCFTGVFSLGAVWFFRVLGLVRLEDLTHEN